MIAGISYALAAAIVGAIVWFFVSGSETPQIPAGQTPDVASVERLHEIRDLTAEVRRLDVATGVKEGYLSREALGEYIDDSYSELSDRDRRDLETQTIVLRMLRMIEPDDDLIEIYAASNSLGIAGFYDYEQKSLVVVADNLTGTLNEELTLAHEYTHALQDQRFALQRYFVSREAAEAEYGTTLSCVVEGDASLAQVKYMEALYGEDWILQLIAELAQDDELSELTDELQTEVPPAVIRYVYFNYNQCANFVEAIWDEGGWDAVDALYADPPSTTEQVLHPERYMEGEEALPLELADIRSDLGLGWRLAYGGAFGEFDVYNYLITGGLSASSARNAAEGWGAGESNIYTLGAGEGMNVVLHVALLWDDASAFNQFQIGLDAVIDRLGYTQRGGDADIWSWSGVREYGRAIWDTDTLRVDLVFGTDESVVDRAESSLTAAD